MKRSLVAVAAVVLAAGAFLWFDRAEQPQRERERAEDSAASDDTDVPEVPRAAEPRREVARALSNTVPPAAAAEEETEPSSYDPNIHPHPITPEHLRLYRENELLDGAWQALRKKDFAKARELARTHQRDYPGSNTHMPEGLLLLADCMEHPGPETRLLAQQYYDSRTFSQMRRRIRRLCLEVVPP